MAFSNGKKNVIDKEEVFNKVNELDLLQYYLNITELLCVIHSPLREDKNPSFGLYIYSNNRVGYRDLSKGDRGSLIDLLQQLWGLNFSDTLDRIYNDLDNIVPNSVEIHNKGMKFGHSDRSRPSNIKLGVQLRKMQEHDYEYWSNYGITKEFLKKCKIFAIKRVFIYTPKAEFNFIADKYAYVYVENKDDNISYKIYQPFSKTNKWLNNHDSSVWDLWEILPDTGENLIITSSRKDAMCIWCNTDIPCTSLQAESYFPKEQVVQELKDRFKNVYVLYDNDFNAEENHGRLLGRKIADTFDLKQIEIPTKYKSKDASDLYLNLKGNNFRSIITNLLY